MVFYKWQSNNQDWITKTKTHCLSICLGVYMTWNLPHISQSKPVEVVAAPFYIQITTTSTQQLMAGKVHKFTASLFQAQLSFSACSDLLGCSSRVILCFYISTSASVVEQNTPPSYELSCAGAQALCVLLLLAASWRGEMEAPISPETDPTKASA